MNYEKLKFSVTLGAAAALAALFLWLLGKYLAACLAPFIIAYIVSRAVRPAAAFISRRAGVGRRFVSVFIVIILIAAIFFLFSYVATVISEEAAGVASTVSDWLSDEDNALKSALDHLFAATDRFPVLSESGGALYGAVTSVVKEALSSAASFAASAASNVISGLPKFVLAVVTTVIATFYLCTDKGKIQSEVASFIGDARAAKLSKVRERLDGAVASYFKGYLTLMLLTLAELVVAFLLLGVDNALFLALTLALIDMLPVLGAGTIIVPWALIELFAVRDTALGAGLLATAAVMYVVRQIAEPRIIGGAMGVHPLITLTSAYVGLVLFGIAGVIILPMSVYFVKALIKQKEPAVS